MTFDNSTAFLVFAFFHLQALVGIMGKYLTLLPVSLRKRNPGRLLDSAGIFAILVVEDGLDGNAEVSPDVALFINDGNIVDQRDRIE
jgi:hypothetical protein